MPHGNVKKKAIEPVGPFAPPTPAEAEQAEGKPMAVAGDEETTDDAFKPTTNPDPGLPTPTPHGRDITARHDANRAREKPAGYSRVDEHGFRHLEAEEAEDQPSGRLAMESPSRDVERAAETDEDEAR